MTLVHRFVWKPFRIVTVTLSIWNSTFWRNPFSWLGNVTALTFSHIFHSTEWQAFGVSFRVCGCMYVFCDNSCRSAEKHCCSYQKTLIPFGKWLEAFMPALLRILFSRRAIWIRHEIVPKTAVALKHTSLHDKASLILQDRPTRCAVENEHLSLVSWYMLRPVTVSSSHLKKPRLSSRMPEVFRARGFSCYRTSLQGTFHCPSAGIRKRVIKRWCTRWLSWLRLCAFADSILDVVTGIFHWHNPSGRTVALRSTQTVTEMSTMCIS